MFGPAGYSFVTAVPMGQDAYVPVPPVCQNMGCGPRQRPGSQARAHRIRQLHDFALDNSKCLFSLS